MELSFELGDGGGVGDFFSVFGADVERIEGSAFFGANAGVDDFEFVVVNGVEDVVEKSDAVKGLEFDDGVVRVEVVADEGADGELNDLLFFGFEDVDLFFEIRGGVVVWVLVDLVESINNSVEFRGIGGGGEVVGADAEEVEGDLVGAGVDIGGEDVEGM